MIKLHARLGKRRDAEPFVARVSRGSLSRSPDREREVLFVDRGEGLIPGYRAYLDAGGRDESLLPGNPEVWPIPEPLQHLSDGDIIRISPRSGELWVMYRRASAFNGMLLTAQLLTLAAEDPTLCFASRHGSSTTPARPDRPRAPLSGSPKAASTSPAPPAPCP